jgi:hypothetical protein
MKDSYNPSLDKNSCLPLIDWLESCNIKNSGKHHVSKKGTDEALILKIGKFHGDSSHEKIANHNVERPNVQSYGQGGGSFKPSNFKQCNLFVQQSRFCYNCGENDHW